jgi:hypothetical protein
MTRRRTTNAGEIQKRHEVAIVKPDAAQNAHECIQIDTMSERITEAAINVFDNEIPTDDWQPTYLFKTFIPSPTVFDSIEQDTVSSHEDTITFYIEKGVLDGRVHPGVDVETHKIPGDICADIVLSVLYFNQESNVMYPSVDMADIWKKYPDLLPDNILPGKLYMFPGCLARIREKTCFLGGMRSKNLDTFKIAFYEVESILVNVEYLLIR